MFEQVKQEIDDKIKTNGNNEITANRLNGVLQDMMDASAEVIEEVQQSIGDQVEANPTGDATIPLNKIKIGETNYNIPQTDTSALATKTELQQGLSGKQDTINDLSDIRSGAAAGASALQPVQNATPNNFAIFDSNGGLQDSGCNEGTFIKGVKKGTETLTPVNGVVTVPSDIEGAQATSVSSNQSATATIDSNHVLQLEIPRGADGADAVNPFKGWYESTSNLPANPVVGDYAYVKGASSTDPAAIYECTTAGSWSDSGRTADTSNVQTFASGEEVNAVGIDDEPTAGSNNLVKSGGVAEETGLLRFTNMVDSGKIVIENGSIGSSGENFSSTSRLRTKDAIPTNIGNISVPDGFLIQAVFYYSAWENEVSYTYSTFVTIGAQSAKLDTSYNYARPIFRNSANNDIVADDLMNALYLVSADIIKRDLYGFTGDITLIQYYASSNGGDFVAIATLPTRVCTLIVPGNYTIKTKQGYVIRGVTAWNGGPTSGVVTSTIYVTSSTNLVSGGSLTEFTKRDNWESSIITFCKTDASANILPTEDIIADFQSLDGLMVEVEELKEAVKNQAIKNAVFMGDSITHGVYSYWNSNAHEETDRYNGFDISNLNSVAEATAYHGIPYYFGLLAKCPNPVVNLAKRGTGYVADSRNLGNALEVANSYDFTDVDFVALCFGVNDYIQGNTIGDIATKETGTIIGNMCATIEKILTDNPLCKVVVYSPYNTWGQVSYGGDYTSNILYGNEASNYALGHTINGNTLQDIIDAEEIVCNYYGIQIINLSKSNVINRLTIKNILIDGLHPSKESYIKLAAEIYGKGNFGD